VINTAVASADGAGVDQAGLPVETVGRQPALQGAHGDGPTPSMAWMAFQPGSPTNLPVIILVKLSISTSYASISLRRLAMRA
jgi:hypothetical protein